MNEFQLGQHNADIETLKTDVQSIKKDVRSLVLAEERRRGAWKVAAFAGAFFGAIASFSANIIKILAERP